MAAKNSRDIRMFQNPDTGYMEYSPGHAPEDQEGYVDPDAEPPIDSPTNTTTTTTQYPISESQSTSGSSNESTSSLPDWAEEAVQWVSNNYAGTGWQNYTQALNNLSQSPTYIEEYRTTANQQYQNDILQPTMDAVTTAINTAAGQGVMNSSITESMINQAVEDALATSLEQQNTSNMWAAEQNLGALETNANAWGSYAGLIGDYLGLTKESESEGSSGSSSYSYTLPESQPGTPS